MKFDLKTASITIVVIIVAVLAYSMLNTREHRSLGEKMDDAVGQLDNGVDNAARELKDRTPAEKIKDEVKDATDGK